MISTEMFAPPARTKGRVSGLFLPTDQNACYGDNGAALPCAGTGQDADRVKAAPGPRFEVRGETVFDAATGALWTLNANPAEFPVSHAEALAFAADMAAAKAHGQSTWQLPPRRVLFSLVSHQQTRPALPAGHPFRNVFAGNYWTADSVSRLARQAWLVDLGGGRAPKADKQDGALVWPVCLPPELAALAADTGAGRGEGRNESLADGQTELPAAQARFALQGPQVLDRLTGLIWSREAGPAGAGLTWSEALERVAALNREGYGQANDWRLPDIRELESLVDLARHSPALAPAHPFTGLGEGYWSSTTSLYEPRYAWALYMRDGMVGVGYKPDAAFCLWPVRGRCFFP